jgi:hypothetical protein
MIPVRVSDLEKAAELRGNRREEYLRECFARSMGDGHLRLFYENTYHEIRAKYPAGLGDIVERAAKPIARLMDKLMGTDLENCGGCEGRRQALNEMFPR